MQVKQTPHGPIPHSPLNPSLSYLESMTGHAAFSFLVSYLPDDAVILNLFEERPSDNNGTW